jgi:hypothetical protein
MGSVGATRCSTLAPRHAKGHLAPARQIRASNVSNSLAEPRQFQPQKYLEDFEFGQLFSSNPRAYD